MAAVHPDSQGPVDTVKGMGVEPLRNVEINGRPVGEIQAYDPARRAIEGMVAVGAISPEDYAKSMEISSKLSLEPADIYPRSRKPVDLTKAESAVRLLLEAIGEDPNRPGLKGTPLRVAKLYREFMEYEPGKLDTAFESSVRGAVVAVSGIRVWSLCEHHLLPYYADMTIAYIPSGKVIGLSKIARIAHNQAHHLSLQERLVDHVVSELTHHTGSKDIAVHAQGAHLCMVMRGIKTPAIMHTTKFNGQFENSLALQQQFLATVNQTTNPL